MNDIERLGRQLLIGLLMSLLSAEYRDIKAKEKLTDKRAVLKE